MKTLIDRIAGAAVAVLLSAAVLGVPAQAAEEPAEPPTKLYLFNWAQYISPEIIRKFEEQYNADVVQNFFSSNAALQAKLQSGGVSQYDVIIPSSYFVPRLAELGLIQKLDHGKIPNLDNLYPKFSDPAYDPGNQYSVPYQWGTTGIAYNTEAFPNPPESWALLFDPEVNPDQPFALLLENGQVIMGAACAYLGLGYTCTGKDDWVKAAQLIIDTKQRDNMVAFLDGTPGLNQLEQGIVDAVVTYNGDFAFDAAENPEAFEHFAYFLPKEGTELWVDTMAIPAEAPHPELAHQFINFILKPKIGAQLSNWNYYASPNKASKPYLDPILQKSLITPTPEQIKRLHFTPILEGEELNTFQEIWTQVRAW